MVESMEDHSVTIRPMKWRDIEWARQQRNSPETRQWLGHTSEISFSEQVKWFWKLLKDPTKARMVILSNSNRIGVVRIDSIDYTNMSVCIGMDIDPKHRGKGYCQEAYKLLLRYLFGIGWNRIWLLVGDYNKRGIHIYQKVGFKFEGNYRQGLYRDGKFHDYYLMGILREEYNEQ